MRFLSFLMIFILFSISNYAQKKSNIVLEPVKKGLTDDQLLEEVFYQNGVDIYFQAHVHNYERDGPIYKNQSIASEFDGDNIHVGPKAPIYITNGNAGNSEGHNDPTSPTPQDWAQYWTNDYGYGRMVVYNNTHLYYEQFSSPETDLIDYVWVVKTKNRYN